MWLSINHNWLLLGFIQPAVLFNQLERNEGDGFISRLLISTPKDVHVSIKDLVEDQEGITILDILTKLKQQHTAGAKYRFADDAKDAFDIFHDELQSLISQTDVFDQPEQRAAYGKAAVSKLISSVAL